MPACPRRVSRERQAQVSREPGQGGLVPQYPQGARIAVGQNRLRRQRVTCERKRVQGGLLRGMHNERAVLDGKLPDAIDEAERHCSR
jgi:hypothetical protein